MHSMSTLHSTAERSASFVVVERHGPRTLDGLIAAAAGMALADGRVEPAEPHSLLEFLRRNNLLSVLGRRWAIQQFAVELKRAAGCTDPGADLSDRLRPLAGMAGARLVAAAAAHVAAADGAVHPQEIALLRSLRSTLGLLPDTASARA